MNFLEMTRSRPASSVTAGRAMSMMYALFAVLAVAAALHAVPAAAQANANALDDAFLAARDAARTGDSKRLDQLAPRFQTILVPTDHNLDSFSMDRLR